MRQKLFDLQLNKYVENSSNLMFQCDVIKETISAVHINTLLKKK